MMARLLILFLLFRLPLFGDAEQDITNVLTDLASALSENNPERFLQKLDHEMPNYRQIERDVLAIANDDWVSCSIEILTNSGDETSQQVDLDWYMVLKSQQDENLIERRRTKVKVKMEKRGKKWM
ncbi:MAG TPA: hypothetical protein VGL72_10385, partial [Bryobacteraceae bacterium]